MKKLSSISVFAALALIFSLIALPASTVFAAYAEGTHEINYEVLKGDSDGASIADGYFTKPATLTVKDGVNYIQLTLTSSDMIESLSVNGSPVEVVSDSGDTRVVTFKVPSDLTEPVNMKMHIIVPDMYDMTHDARAKFDVSSIPAKQSADNGGESATEASSGDATTDDGATDPVENPQTSDKTPIAMYITLLVGSIAVFSVYKFRFARNK